MTILERITPLDLAATAAIRGIHMAMVPELDRKADITVQQITTATRKVRSFLATALLPRALPILFAMPVLKSASPTMHMPATMMTLLLAKPE